MLLRLIYSPLWSDILTHPLISIFLSVVALPLYIPFYFLSAPSFPCFCLLFGLSNPSPYYYLWPRIHPPRPSLQYIWRKQLLYIGVDNVSMLLASATPPAFFQYVWSSLALYSIVFFFNEIHFPLPMHLYLYNWPRLPRPLPGLKFYIKKSPTRAVIELPVTDMSQTESDSSALAYLSIATNLSRWDYGRFYTFLQSFNYNNFISHFK